MLHSVSQVFRLKMHRHGAMCPPTQHESHVAQQLITRHHLSA